jgi:hypothetical protein
MNIKFIPTQHLYLLISVSNETSIKSSIAQYKNVSTG